MKCQTNHYLIQNIQKDKNFLKKLKIKKDKQYAEHIYNITRLNRIKHIKRRILNNCKNRALKKNLEFDLEEQDIIIPETCPILNIPIEYGIKGKYQFSPSIDRIDNTKGYVKSNIQIISMKANSMKNSANSAELLQFAKWINDNYKI